MRTKLNSLRADLESKSEPKSRIGCQGACLKFSYERVLIMLCPKHGNSMTSKSYDFVFWATIALRLMTGFSCKELIMTYLTSDSKPKVGKL